MKDHPASPVTIAFSGTGAGFVKFCRGQLDIADASRPITADEVKTCDANNVMFVELPVAHDAITVIVNAKNAWASSISVAELRALWEPKAEGRITKWSQIRKDWPDRDIRLFGPGLESGTFDYFTGAVNGGAGASRKDYTASADDTVIVKGVASDEGALGYVGYGYYDRAKASLKALAIDDLDDSVGQGAVPPSPASVGRGVYRPLSRPLFIYLNLRRAERPEVMAFAKSYLRHAGELAPQAGTVPLMANVYQLAQQRLAKMVTGTMYQRGNAAELGVEYLLTQ